MPAENGHELIYGMEKSFVPEAAKGVNVVIQYHLTGEGGGDFFVTILDQKIKVADGVADKPNLQFTATTEDYIKISTGELDGMKAVLGGKLKIKGDMGIAIKMQKMFK